MAPSATRRWVYVLFPLLVAVASTALFLTLAIGYKAFSAEVNHYTFQTSTFDIMVICDVTSIVLIVGYLALFAKTAKMRKTRFLFNDYRIGVFVAYLVLYYSVPIVLAGFVGTKFALMYLSDDGTQSLATPLALSLSMYGVGAAGAVAELVLAIFATFHVQRVLHQQYTMLEEQRGHGRQSVMNRRASGRNATDSILSRRGGATTHSRRAEATPLLIDGVPVPRSQPPQQEHLISSVEPESFTIDSRRYHNPSATLDKNENNRYMEPQMSERDRRRVRKKSHKKKTRSGVSSGGYQQMKAHGRIGSSEEEPHSSDESDDSAIAAAGYARTKSKTAVTSVSASTTDTIPYRSAAQQRLLDATECVVVFNPEANDGSVASPLYANRDNVDGAEEPNYDDTPATLHARHLRTAASIPTASAAGGAAPPFSPKLPQRIPPRPPNAAPTPPPEYAFPAHRSPVPLTCNPSDNPFSFPGLKAPANESAATATLSRTASGGVVPGFAATMPHSDAPPLPMTTRPSVRSSSHSVVPSVDDKTVYDSEDPNKEIFYTSSEDDDDTDDEEGDIIGDEHLVMSPEPSSEMTVHHVDAGHAFLLPTLPVPVTASAVPADSFVPLPMDDNLPPPPPLPESDDDTLRHLSVVSPPPPPQQHDEDTSDDSDSDTDHNTHSPPPPPPPEEEEEAKEKKQQVAPPPAKKAVFKVARPLTAEEAELSALPRLVVIGPSSSTSDPDHQVFTGDPSSIVPKRSPALKEGTPAEYKAVDPEQNRANGEWTAPFAFPQ